MYKPDAINIHLKLSTAVLHLQFVFHLISLSLQRDIVAC